MTANLANVLLNKGEALGDLYSSIENLTGSAFNDKLTGNSGANVLEGGKARINSMVLAASTPQAMPGRQPQSPPT